MIIRYLKTALMLLSLLPCYSFLLVADKQNRNTVYHESERQKSYYSGFLLSLLRFCNYGGGDSSEASLADAYSVCSFQYGGEFDRYRIDLFTAKSISKFSK